MMSTSGISRASPTFDLNEGSHEGEGNHPAIRIETRGPRKRQSRFAWAAAGEKQLPQALPDESEMRAVFSAREPSESHSVLAPRLFETTHFLEECRQGVDRGNVIAPYRT